CPQERDIAVGDVLAQRGPGDLVTHEGEQALEGVVPRAARRGTACQPPRQRDVDDEDEARRNQLQDHELGDRQAEKGRQGDVFGGDRVEDVELVGVPHVLHCRQVCLARCRRGLALGRLVGLAGVLPFGGGLQGGGGGQAKDQQRRQGAPQCQQPFGGRSN